MNAFPWYQLSSAKTICVSSPLPSAERTARELLAITNLLNLPAGVLYLISAVGTDDTLSPGTQGYQLTGQDLSELFCSALRTRHNT